jgi:hypothetical protein
MNMGSGLKLTIISDRRSADGGKARCGSILISNQNAAQDGDNKRRIAHYFFSAASISFWYAAASVPLLFAIGKRVG